LSSAENLQTAVEEDDISHNKVCVSSSMQGGKAKAVGFQAKAKILALRLRSRPNIPGRK